MTRPPEPPPEARLLKAARVGGRLSVADAAERARISAGLWRQVEAGYMIPSRGVRVPKVAPAPTLAWMAHAVNLPPEQLECDGQRPDAAEILREIRQQEQARPATDATQLPIPAISPEFDRLIAPHIAEVEARVTVAKAAYRDKELAGIWIFPDAPEDARAWDALAAAGNYSVWQLIAGLAALRARRAELQKETPTEREAG